MTVKNVTITAGNSQRIPASGTSPLLATSALTNKTVYAIGDRNTTGADKDKPIPIISTEYGDGYAVITVAESVTNAELGIQIV